MRVAATTVVTLALWMAVTTASAQELPSRPSSLAVRGYTDFGYLATDRDVPDGFRYGRVVGHLGYRFAGRWAFIAELGVTADTAGFDLAVGQTAVRYEVGAPLRLTAGRFHTPLGYWNTTYHLGAWAQTTVDRPAMLDREGGLLPVYALGLLAEGAIPTGALRLGYTAGVANGRDTDIARPGDAGDADGNQAWMVGLTARPRWLPGSRLGLSLYRDRPAGTAGEVDERIVSVYAAEERDPLELMVEYAHIAHDAPSDAAYGSNAYYAQLAYRLPGRASRVKPYVRIERVDASDADPIFAARGLDYRAALLGVRYDFMPAGAIKAEYRNERFEGTDRFQSLHLQLSFTLSRPSSPPPVLAVVVPPPQEPQPLDPAATDSAARSDSADTTSGRKAAPADGSGAATKGARAAAEPVSPIAIVVHPETPVEGVSLPELRRIFRGEQQYWPGNEKIVLLVRPPLAREREIVLGRIYQMDEEGELRQFLLSKIFRNTAASGPKMVSDIETARQLVATLPGAISFMPAAQVGPGLRVLRVDGKLPGESGYPLQ